MPREHKATGAVRDIARELIAQPFVGVRGMAQQANVTFAAANRAALRLVEVGILREVTGRDKNRLFVADAVMEILTRI